MDIAIIGSGNVGRAIAQNLAGKGHTVFVGSRTAHAAAEAPQMTGVTILSPVVAAARANLVILALPWAAAEGAIKALGDLAGKTVIDCMNPLGMVGGSLGLTLGFDQSAGEMVQRWLPMAHVVKTLNQVGAEVMADPARFPHRPVMFVAGNNEDAKLHATQLLAELGFEALDAGDITKSRLLEPFAMVWINQALFRGKGRDWALAAVSS